MRNTSNLAPPPFAAHGGGNMGLNLPGPYPGFPASLSLSPAAGNFPMDPPAMPRDAEMLKNIDVLSSFVVKNGPDFEQLARKKQIGDPKFAFLFGGEPDTDAAIGQRYYEWKKRALEASLRSQGCSSLHSGRAIIQDDEKLTSDAPASPVGSDMDMEDDFAAPPVELEKKVASPLQVIETKAFPVIEVNKQEEAMSVSEGRNFRAVAPGAKEPDTGTGPMEDIPSESRRRGTRWRTGFDRSCMEDISSQRKSASPPEQALPCGRERVSQQERKPSSGVNGPQTEGASKASQWGPPEPSLTPEAAKLDVASSPQELQKSEVRGKLQTVSPPKADDDVDLPEIHGRTDARGIRDPKHVKRKQSSSGLELGAPTVDEFGRLVRHDSSDSDGEDGCYGKKQRRSPSWSRSRSRSPRENLRRRRSHSQSRSRRSRRSRSRSHSSRRHRSYSRSPPRDSRRGPDSSWGSDRRFQEQGGRRGGHVERGGATQPVCLDFSRGRCYRGSSCRFLHLDNSSNGASSGDPGRGGGRYGSRSGRGSHGENNDDSEQALGSGRSSSGRGDEGPRARRNWDSTTERQKENKEEKVLEAREGCKPEESPASDYGDDQSHKLIKAKTKEKSESKTMAGKPSSFTDPPPLAPLPSSAPFSLPHSATFTPDVVNSSIATLPPQAPAIFVFQAFSSVPSAQSVPAFAMDVPEKDYTTDTLMMQPGFDGSLPPPPPMAGFVGHHHPSSQLQAPYSAPTSQPTAYSQTGGHRQPVGIPQMGVQHLPVPSRPGLAWPTAYAIDQSMQGYGLPGPTSSLAQQTNSQPVSQHPGVSASKEQYNPLMADAFEPEPPGARDVGPNPEFGGPQDMSMVIMERVSPGLPSRHHSVTSSVNQGTHNGLLMESVNPRTLAPLGKEQSHSVRESLPSHPAVEVSTYRSLPSLPDHQGGGVLENVSPASDENRDWNSGLLISQRDSGKTRDTKERDGNQSQAEGKNDKEGHSREGRNKEGRDKEGHEKEGRGLTLVRAAVTEYVKDVLKPTWREGHMSKEAFKTIAKKAVDKVLGALQPHQIPKTPEKVDAYMASSRPKIHKLVQGYVDKYVKI